MNDDRTKLCFCGYVIIPKAGTSRFGWVHVKSQLERCHPADADICCRFARPIFERTHRE